MELIWRAELDSEVFAVPCLCSLPLDWPPALRQSVETNSESETATETCEQPVPRSTSVCCVCACSTSGVVYILDMATGSVLGSYKLPSNVFSSPVSAMEGHIVVGCRDDCVYCLSCTITGSQC